MSWETFALAFVQQINEFYQAAFADLRMFAVFAFILLVNFTPLGAIRSGLLVMGAALLLSLYGLIVLTVSHPLMGCVVGLNSLMVGLWGVYQLQKKLA